MKPPSPFCRTGSPDPSRRISSADRRDRRPGRPRAGNRQRFGLQADLFQLLKGQCHLRRSRPQEVVLNFGVEVGIDHASISLKYRGGMQSGKTNLDEVRALGCALVYRPGWVDNSLKYNSCPTRQQRISHRSPCGDPRARSSRSDATKAGDSPRGTCLSSRRDSRLPSAMFRAACRWPLPGPVSRGHQTWRRPGTRRAAALWRDQNHRTRNRLVLRDMC